MLNKNKSNSLKAYLKGNFSQKFNFRARKVDRTFRVYVPQMLISFTKKIPSKIVI